MLTLRRRARTRGMTLVEVMIALGVTLFFTLGTLGVMQRMSAWTMRTAYYAEAHRLAMRKAEELRGGAQSAFVASTAETVTSAITTKYNRSINARNTYQNVPASSRVTYTRSVVDLGTTAGVRSLRVNVTWRVGNHPQSVSILVARKIS